MAGAERGRKEDVFEGGNEGERDFFALPLLGTHAQFLPPFFFPVPFLLQATKRRLAEACVRQNE